MPKRKQPRTLETLAAKFISVSVQETCKRIDSEDNEQNSVELKSKLENFAINLPSATLECLFNEVIAGLLERLQRNKNEKGLMAALNCMLQPNMRVVDLGSMFFKVRLSRELSRSCASLLPARLSCISLLTRLNLCSRCTDSALQAVAGHCPNLIYLNISYSDLVTDGGLLSLSGNGEDTGCLKLQYLGLMKLWDITVKGIAALVERLPALTVLNYDRCGDMIEHMKPSKQTLLLTNFDQSYYIYNPTYEQTAYIGSVCPKIVSLNVYVADQSLPLFSVMENVQKVDIELDGPAGSGLESWIACAGPKLKTLNLTFESLTWKQLETICRHCPNLQTMRLLGSELVWDEGAEMSVKFPAVEQLRISVWGDTGVSATLLSWVLESAAPTLTVLSLDACAPFLNDSYFARMLSHHLLPRLKELALTGAPKGHLTVESAQLAMHFCPDLRKVAISGFSVRDSERNRLLKEIRENNFDLELV